MNEPEENVDRAIGRVQALYPVIVELRAINAAAQDRDYAAVQARAWLLHQQVEASVFDTIAAHPIDNAA